MPAPKSRRGGYRHGRRRKLSTQPHWSSRQRAWLKKVEYTGDLIIAMKKGDPLHGEKWRRAMLTWYLKILSDACSRAPKGCEKPRDALAKYLKTGVV